MNRSRLMVRAIFVIATVFAVACGGSDTTSSSTGSDGTDGTSGTSATTASDATTGTDGTNATDGTSATDGTESFEMCGSPADCDAGQLCDCLGRCVPPGIAGINGCTEDKNCGSDNYCDTCASACRPIKELCAVCEGDNECEDGAACLDFATGGRFCLQACVSDVGCPQPGFSCFEVDGQAQKQCVPLSGKCQTPALCQDDVECEFGAICDLGKCRPGCPDDAACPNGKVCSKFRCDDACDDATNPCGAGQLCQEGHCKKEGGCLEAADCVDPETYCDLAEELCKPGCLQDFDCKASGKECKGGTCVDKGCTGNFLCAFEQVCNMDSGKCEQAVGPYCEPDCDPMSDTACGGEPNRCLELQDDEGNSLGAFCFVGCGPDPANACPQGYACQELKDDMDMVQAVLCIRDCTTKPLGVE
ncbi:MAG: hypothetical protein ACI9OJ_002328 [Myxococcota bacterium]|jgi:hypothetical protein